MNVKEAVAKAKEHVSDIFADEQLLNIGLEELRREGNDWLVTVGFSDHGIATMCYLRSEATFRYIGLTRSSGLGITMER